MTAESFTVDTQLFRELGDLLVGKDSTALAELVKNAYDADARSVTIIGTNLSVPDAATIAVNDDGTGMTETQFRQGFLTIAGRGKNTGDRRSPIFGRVLTGEKGVGRLAARKLARRMVVDTRAHDGSPVRGSLAGEHKSLTATIDWDKIEACTTLDKIEAAGAIRVVRHKDSSARPRAGTTITLGPLRRAWTDRGKSNFVKELKSLQPWPSLVDSLPRRFGRLIFDRLETSQSVASTTPFELRLEGEFVDFDPLGPAAIGSATWVVEIECDVQASRIIYALAPAKPYWKKEFGLELEAARFERPIDQTDDFACAFNFKARIFEREQENWEPAIGGIRVFLDGFRVLPYGERGDDWLDIDSDYGGRQHGRLPGLRGVQEAFPAGKADEWLSMKRNAAYLGAVLVSKDDAPELEVLVTREGFVPGPKFEWLRKQVRVGVDVMTRARVADTAEAKRERRDQASELRRASERDAEQTPSALLLQDRAREARATIERARQAFARNDSAAAATEVSKLEAEILPVISKAAEEMGTEQAMLRVLASVGSQLWALSHEITSLLELAATSRRLLDRIAGSEGLSREQVRALREVSKRHSDLHHGLERQAVYLTDVAGLEARRRRARQPLRQRFDAAQRVLQFAIDRKELVVENELPEDVRSPAMFPAEVVALFTNLLSNAVKAAKPGGRIRVRAGRSPGRVIVENTGAAVDVEDSEKWFKPFRSTTVATHASLGQGMGLGLTIARSILDEYGAEIHFVKPSKPYATAIEIDFSEG